MVDKNRPFTVTEWEWFQTKVQLWVLKEYRYPEQFLVSYDFDPESNFLFECSIYAEAVSEMVENGTTLAEQLECYGNWISFQKQGIQEILERIPNLRNEIDLSSDVRFRVLYSYGMGAVEVCFIIGDEVRWS